MNGTWKNYALHALGGCAIWFIAFSVCVFPYGFISASKIGVLSCTVWYFSHEVADREHKIPGPARSNVLEAINVFKWTRDEILDFVSPVLSSLILMFLSWQI
jgi:hypothetical protein